MEQLHNWACNLADQFPWLPDGAVLWAETLLRRDEFHNRMNFTARKYDVAFGQRPLPLLRDDAAEIGRLMAEPAYKDACRYFTMLARRGPPLLTGTLAMAVRQERLFRRVVKLKPAPDRADQGLKEACQAVRRAADYAVSDGLFGAFVSRSGPLSPHAVLGQHGAQTTPRRAARSNSADSELSYEDGEFISTYLVLNFARRLRSTRGSCDAPSSAPRLRRTDLRRRLPRADLDLTLGRLEIRYTGKTAVAED